MSLKKRLLLVLACALPLVAGGWLWWLDASGKAAVAAAKERIRAAGLPLTIDEIRPPHVPDADNAALIMEKFRPLLKPMPEINGDDLSGWLSDFEWKHMKDDGGIDNTATDKDDPGWFSGTAAQRKFAPPQTPPAESALETPGP